MKVLNIINKKNYQIRRKAHLFNPPIIVGNLREVPNFDSWGLVDHIVKYMLGNFEHNVVHIANRMMCFNKIMTIRI